MAAAVRLLRAGILRRPPARGHLRRGLAPRHGLFLRPLPDRAASAWVVRTAAPGAAQHRPIGLAWARECTGCPRAEEGDALMRRFAQGLAAAALLGAVLLIPSAGR